MAESEGRATLAKLDQPEVFGKYHLLEKIATGGMAEVYRARAYGKAGFEKILVIKKVLATLAEDDEFVGLFIDEARIAVQLLHVNIVQVFDLGQVDGRYYTAMEYVHGLDLSRLIARARPEERQLVALSMAKVAMLESGYGEDGSVLQRLSEKCKLQCIRVRIFAPPPS